MHEIFSSLYGSNSKVIHQPARTPPGGPVPAVFLRAVPALSEDRAASAFQMYAFLERSTPHPATVERTRTGHMDTKTSFRRRDVLKALSLLPAAWTPWGKRHTPTPPLVFCCSASNDLYKLLALGSAIFAAL